MSARLLGLAFAAEAESPSAKLILLKLVDCCDDDGKRIFPAMASLATAGQCSRSTTKRVVRRFTEVGLLRLVREGGSGPRNTNCYEMDLDILNRLAREGWHAVAGTPCEAPHDASYADDACLDENEDDPAVAESASGASCVKNKRSMVNPLIQAQGVHGEPLRGSPGEPQPLNSNPQYLERESAGADVQAGVCPDAQRLSRPAMPAHGHAPDARRASGVASGQSQGQGPSQEAGQGEKAGRGADDARPVPQLAEFVKAWPTSVADDQVRVANAWGELTIDDRRAALAGIGPYRDALKKLKKDHPPSGWRYLRDKSWTLIGDIERKAEAGQPVEVKPWSRAWWALWHAALLPGSGRNPALMLQRAVEGRPGAEMQFAINAVRPEALKGVPADGEAGLAYRERMAARRLHLPRFQPGTWIYLREADLAGAALNDAKHGGL